MCGDASLSECAVVGADCRSECDQKEELNSTFHENPRGTGLERITCVIEKKRLTDEAPLYCHELIFVFGQRVEICTHQWGWGTFCGGRVSIFGIGVLAGERGAG